MVKRVFKPIPEELREFWLEEENLQLDKPLVFDKMSAGSNKKAWWLINGVKKYVMIKSVVNNRKTKPNPIPEEYRENWLEEKNAELGLSFDTLTKSSHKKAWWTFKGQEQYISVDSAIRNNPKSLKNPIPQIYREFWVEDMNAELGLTFDTTSLHSTKEAYWYLKGDIIKLKVGIALRGEIKKRLKEKFKKRPKGNFIPESYYNDLFYLEDCTNYVMDLDELTISNMKSVHWKCKEHISYQQNVSSHTSGKGCSYCTGRLVHPFDSVWGNKELLKQWSPNNGIEPEKVHIRSTMIRKWLDLETGEEFEQSVLNRHKGLDPKLYRG